MRVQYTSARPKGYIAWSPCPSLALRNLWALIPGTAAALCSSSKPLQSFILLPPLPALLNYAFLLVIV